MKSRFLFLNVMLIIVVSITLCFGTAFAYPTGKAPSKTYTKTPVPKKPMTGWDSQTGFLGIKGGVNMFDPMIGMAYEKHPDASASHIAAYGGYDFGQFRVGGTMWNYFLTASDGIWRTNGADPIDQTYVEFGSSSVIGPTVDVSFDVPVGEMVRFTPGVGVGVGFRYGKIKQYDMVSKPGVVIGNRDEGDLTEDEVEPESEDNGKNFMPVWPLVHIDADWAILFSPNFYATVNLGFQTFGPSAGLGFGYHF